EFQVEAKSLLAELNENLSLNLKSLRLLNVYDLFGFTQELLTAVVRVSLRNIFIDRSPLFCWINVDTAFSAKS
ncbi:MAG: hypothetical protein SPL26_04305, partial [Bacteroidales bacterium]|nr:hypothetical protein [Bacteroidales bacterium]